ncbi:hypothetical protein ACVNF4_17570 [Streptomyces sp. S6]
MKRGLALAVAVAALSMGDTGVLAAPPQRIDAWCADSECGSSYRIKFAWAYGSDSECFTIHPGELWTRKRAHSWMRFDGIRSC